MVRFCHHSETFVRYEGGDELQAKFDLQIPGCEGITLEHEKQKSIANFLREAEMHEVIAAETDPITRDLMRFALNCLVSRTIRQAEAPIADFDLKYFIQVVQEFASDQEGLRLFLDGKGSETVWLAEDSVSDAD